MKIASSIDYSLFEENGEFTENSKRLLMEYADGYFESMDEIKPMINAGICGLKGRINEKLQEHNQKAYEAISGFVESKEYQQVAMYDYELKCFAIANKIYEIEKLQDTCIYDLIEYSEHFLDIYYQLLFWFRRIQLRLAKPLQLEGMRFVREKGISVYAIVQVLLDCELGGKEIIALSLSEMFIEQNRRGEAIYILSVVGDYCRPEWKSILEQRKEELLG